MTLPTIEHIEALHKKYAPSPEAFTEVWQHCIIIKEIADWCIEQGAVVDQDLVTVGCLLHDIGVYTLYQPDGTLDGPNYIQHGIRGYDILKAEGFDKTICNFAAHHTGVGLTAEEIVRNNLPLPVQDMLAETPEERLAMYADKFHSKGPAAFNTPEWYKSHVAAKFGQQKVDIFNSMVQEFGIPPVQTMATRHAQHIR